MWNVRFRTGTFFCVGCLVAGMTLSSGSADESQLIDSTDPKYTITDPDTRDKDLELTGEFAGTIQPSRYATQAYGLQVVAMGGGRFQGRLLVGGLPGAGWNGYAQIRLTGEREGRKLTLIGGPFAVSLAGISKTATVRYKEGDTNLGQLFRANRESPTMGAPVPSSGNQLFPVDDQIAGAFPWSKMDINAEGFLKAGAETFYGYRDFKLHVEFRTPFMPNARGQARGNSGIYLNSRYEVQILDSFGLAGGEDDCGSIYRTKKPDVNMTFPPLTWQTYDITYVAPVFNAKGKKLQNAVLTVLHNGVLIHDQVEVDGQTGLRSPEESDDPMALKLQDHGNPVVFRNVWIAPIVEENPQPAAVEVPYCPPTRRGRRR